MDLATHVLAALLLARTAPPPAATREATCILVAGALAPDVDVLVVLFDPTRAALLRHAATHSLPALPILATGIAVLGKAAGARSRFGRCVLLAAVGVALHLGLDLLNAYGVLLFHPLSDRRVEFALLFVVDPVLLGLLAAGIGLSGRPSLPDVHRRGAAVLAIVLAVSHVGLAVILRDRAAGMLAAATAGSPVDLVPEPFAPWRWRGIVARADGFDQFDIRPLGGSVRQLAAVRSDHAAPAVSVVRASAMGPVLDGFFRAPVWAVEGDRVSVHDLRYRFAALGNDWDPFGFVFQMSPDGSQASLREARLGDRTDRALSVMADILGGRR